MRRQHGRYVVVGGSIAGLSTALALARAGVPVTLLERDDIPVAGDPEAAFAIERLGAPQAHQFHCFLARMVMVLRNRFPDVLADLEATGAWVEDGMGLGDGLGILYARRSTIEWLLRRALEAEPAVEVRTGCRVAGVEGRAVAGARVPTVTGARLCDGSVVEGTVVACTGRRRDLPGWLRGLGVDVPERLVESELIYITRWYALEPGSVRASRMLGDLGYLFYLAAPGDGDTLAVAVAVHPSDRELRALLLDDEGFGRIAALLPKVGRVMTECGARPIRSSQPMAGLVNRLRRFLDGDGAPLVLGFHALGDAHTCTNPAYGRGCSLALVQAVALADAAVAHSDDPAARAIAYETACARQVEPWFHNSVLMDAMRRRVGTGSPPLPSGPDFLRLFRDLAAGRLEDSVLVRGFARMVNLLVTPEELLADGDFLARAAALAAAPPAGPSERVGPTREELLQAAA